LCYIIFFKDNQKFKGRVLYKIKNISIEDINESKYLNLQRIHYEQDGSKKSWDITTVHDSVAILIYKTDTDELLLVKQFRPAIYLKNNDGFTYELCAGIIDKEKSIEDIAKEEILEECGFYVKELQKITSFHTSVGFAGAKQSLFFAKVDESMRISCGGGIENEMIELVYLKRESLKEFIFDESKVKTPGLMFAFYWFIDNSF
jgi:UDP-sugar diphosphatase